MFIRLKRFQLLYKVYIEAAQIPEHNQHPALCDALHLCRTYENSELTDQMCFGNAQKDHAEVSNMEDETKQMQQDIVLRELGVPGTLDKYKTPLCKNCAECMAERAVYCYTCGYDQGC